MKVDPFVPQYLPPVEPWGRYEKYSLAVSKQYRGRDLFENKHPLAIRELVIFHYNSRYVDRGALLKETVTRPTAAMLTWPKRFECSAFWGTMDLLEIDGKSSPGKKHTLSEDSKDDAAPGPAAKEPKTPTMTNAEQVGSLAKENFSRLRESTVLHAMRGPAPSGIDKKDRAGFDQFIFSAAKKDKTRFLEDDDDDAEGASPVPSAGCPHRAFQITSTCGAKLCIDDLSAIKDLTATLEECLMKYDAVEMKLEKVIDLYEKAEGKLSNCKLTETAT
mmetsp:Transcript_20779/g.38830  ORF Transcript_20779/g.38830 Transcript_20779/m.38830 type:complete len:275 (+) Transcript_20779:88-912(+)